MSLENLHDKLNSGIEKSLSAHNLASKLSSGLHEKLDSYNIAKTLKAKTSLGTIEKILESQNKLKALTDSPLKKILATPEWAKVPKWFDKSDWMKAPKLVPDLGFKDIFKGPLYELAYLNSKLGTVQRFAPLTNLESISDIVRHQNSLGETLKSLNNIKSILSVGEGLRSLISANSLAKDITLASAYRNNTLAGYFDAIEKQKRVLAHTSAFDKLVHKKWAKDYEYGEWDIEEDYGDSSPGEDPIDKFKSLMEDLGPTFNTGEPPFKSTFDMLKEVKLAPADKPEEGEGRQYFILNDTTFYLRAYDIYYNKYVLYVLYLLLCLKALKQGD